MYFVLVAMIYLMLINSDDFWPNVVNLFCGCTLLFYLILSKHLIDTSEIVKLSHGNHITQS